MKLIDEMTIAEQVEYLSNNDVSKKELDQVDWSCISEYQQLSEPFIEKHNLTILETNWLYKTPEEKLAYVKNNKLDQVYELLDNKFIIAYKSIRSNNYSVFNFQYKYEVGGTYQAHCDCNINNEDSFGLSAWTKEKALGYYNKGKLMKVRINIEDIGCFVQNDEKIRCCKLTVLKEVENKRR